VEKPPCCLSGFSLLHYVFWFSTIPPCPTHVHIDPPCPCVCNVLLGQCYSMHNKFGHCYASYNITQEMHVYKKNLHTQPSLIVTRSTEVGKQ
jgi:hypothetical protein